ncbi:hypothetical protein CBL_03276 [Carabus blaptoides fortunei]
MVRSFANFARGRTLLLLLASGMYKRFIVGAVDQNPSLAVFSNIPQNERAPIIMAFCSVRDMVVHSGTFAVWFVTCYQCDARRPVGLRAWGGGCRSSECGGYRCSAGSTGLDAPVWKNDSADVTSGRHQ